MAQRTLWVRYSIFLTLTVALLAFFSYCQANDGRIGITLLFQSSGMQVGVLRFDPDGRRGPVPGAVGGMYPHGGAEMAFMPGDSRYTLPKFVEIEWMVATPSYSQEWKILSNRSDQYSKQWINDANAANAKAPHYIKHVDLTSIITPQLLDKVRADSQNVALKLTITFHNDSVNITASDYKWR